MRPEKSSPKHSDGLSVVYTGLLVDYLKSRGLDATAVLGQTLPTYDGYTLTRIRQTQWSAMLDRAARELDDPLLGLHLGQSITPTHFGVLGYALLSCANVAQTLQRWQQYERLVHDLTRLQMRPLGATMVLEWVTTNKTVYGLVDETALAAYVQFVRNITGTVVAPERVCFRHAAPLNSQPYEDHFGCPVLFSQAYMSIQLHTAVFDLPLRQADAALLSMMEHQAALLLDKLREVNDLVRSVRSCIAKQARQGDLSLDHVAASLNLSARTLHRHLAREGWNFRDLRSDTRSKLAESYLRNPALTLGEIAWLLGYSEQSAFTRAFRQWTGVAPGSWRGGVVT
jgi:AraC-like DNA-binding protein